MSRNKNFSKTDRRLIYIAIIGILICLYFLLFDSGHSKSDRTGQVEIGSISLSDNDTRHKEKGTYVWTPLDSEEKVYIGDSIYSGKKSQVTVTLNEGGSVNVGENSLVTFENLDNQSVLDLESGKFKLKVNGSMRVAMQGELMTIDGSKSEVEVVIAKNKKPQIKVTTGTAKIKKDTTIVKFDATVVMKPLNYYWKLYDHFILIGNELFEREEPVPFVNIPNKISWSHIANKPAMLEWADNPRFLKKTSFQAPANGFDLNKAFIGDNYWRVSFDGLEWSKPQKFTLNTDFVPRAEPVPDSLYYEVPFLSDSLSLSVPLKTSLEPTGFVVQASLDEKFKPSDTKSFWSPSKSVNLSFYKPGMYYYRFKTVNQNQEISTWSKTVRFNIFKPDAPQAPLVAKNSVEGMVGDKMTVAWKSKPQVTRFEIFESTNRKIKRSKGNSFSWIPAQPGRYKARAYQVNKYGLQSPASNFIDIVIHPKPVIAKEERKPAKEENTVKAKNKKPVEEKLLNERYKYSQFTVQGMLWTIQSTEQKINNTSPPYTTGLGLHTLLWKGSHGFEGTFKSGVLGFNEPGRDSTPLKSIEPRYHYRFITRSPFSFTRELMYSFFAGFEVYRNSATNVSNQYDLMKFGTSIEFPLKKHWATGGEFVYGHGLDSSTKFEVSGNLHYFFDPDWSFGFGYRLHLFDAGSEKSSAAGILPYREGYTEGFSVLNYYF